jgi:hypothetical protein
MAKKILGDDPFNSGTKDAAAPKKSAKVANKTKRAPSRKTEAPRVAAKKPEKLSEKAGEAEACPEGGEREAREEARGARARDRRCAGACGVSRGASGRACSARALAAY